MKHKVTKLNFLEHIQNIKRDDRKVKEVFHSLHEWTILKLFHPRIKEGDSFLGVKHFLKK